MAFLCPVRIRRGKRKKGGNKVPAAPPSIGRITGSASIETLVRVGIEKENGLSPDSKMVVLHDFAPCVDDELEVRRGQSVSLLYQENDWVYVIAEGGREGFIPHSYCAPHGSHFADLALTRHKKLPRAAASAAVGVAEDGASSRGTHSATDSGQHSDAESYAPPPPPNNDNSSSQGSLPDVHPFFKDPAGRYIVLYTFIARDENDVSVERGEMVTVLNREDPDWFWIVRSDGQEGFVPSAFVCPADVLHDHVGAVSGGAAPHQAGGPGPGAPAPEDLRFHGSELVMLYDYKAQAPDDLSVRRGDWVYADMNNQTVDGWLWAYAPKTRKYGFIPKAYARPPRHDLLMRVQAPQENRGYEKSLPNINVGK
ncbi:SH3 domain-containing protein Dlish-like [Uloborus diversus]|uniref:SH3 domain-containing protein Dlish-like n=1 Tax=Uloborus diversus TaxID=327109 RepID=UPI002409837F|nr:SH3 domain-containing protein Dlish-like [Uloborus diversus]